MKKQKFNGKLRLKKNVISGFNASQIQGGLGGGDTSIECIPTDCTDCVCPHFSEICHTILPCLTGTVQYCNTEEGCVTVVALSNCCD